jgi:SAM-dependent methyltransferase
MLSLPPLADRPPELMDDPALDQAAHDQALTALARINWISGTASQLGRRVIRLLETVRSPHHSPVRVIDIACGGGDLTAAVARYLGRWLHQPVEVVGIDISERAVGWARQRHAGRSGSATISFTHADIVGDGCPPCDIAVHSLFLHHLDDDAAIELLRGMAAAATVGGVFSDLLRSQLGLLLAHAGTTLLARSRVARVDGPLSVKAARTAAEYRQLLDAAGLSQAQIDRTWPERVCVSWTRVDKGQHPHRATEPFLS